MTTIYLSLIAVSSLCICQPAAGNLTENGSIAVTGLKNNTTVVVKDSDSGDNTTLIIGYLTAAGGIATVLIGFRKWLTEQRESRISREAETVKDIILPLIKELDESKEMMYAKNILYDYYIKPEQYWKYPDDYYNLRNLSRILRYHIPNGIDDPGEATIRKSFDALLDFFSKLEYLLSINLLTQQQLEYFRHYIINIAAANKAVVNFVKIHNFPLHGRLHPNLTSK